MKVLIADGDVAFHEILESFLDDRGYEVQLVSNGLNCLAKMNDSPPDVLILATDLLWGGFDGVLSTMQQDPTLSKIPVVLLSNRQLDCDRLSNWFPNLNAILRKPFRLSELLKKLAFLDSLASVNLPS